MLILISASFFGYTSYQKKIYKREYADLVNSYATDYSLEPDFLYAVIKTESNFNPDATSNVGAMGLMQIMPDTFDWVSSKLKSDDKTIANLTYNDMYNPEHNIRFGGYLYSALFLEFGDMKTAIAAYHAGRGNVNKWLKTPAYSSDGKSLDTTPISDTNHYIDKVLKSYNYYINHPPKTN